VEVVLADGTVLKRKGKLQFTDARVSATTGTNEAQAEVPNADGLLKPGHVLPLLHRPPDLRGGPVGVHRASPASPPCAPCPSRSIPRSRRPS
jgi:hypothetical protein